MNVLVYGATGMVGQGVLRECLLAPDVDGVTAVGRTPLAQTHPKLKQLMVSEGVGTSDPAHDSDVALKGFDACFFCLGVSASGLSESDYHRMTYDLTLAVARQLARMNPNMVFIYVSGAGTDSSEQGRSMWARVKGKTENALKALPFRSVYLFRPGLIQPLDGIRSKTPLYQRTDTVLGPLLSVVRWIFPSAIVTTRVVGQAMLNAARQGEGRTVVEAKDLIPLARGFTP